MITSTKMRRIIQVKMKNSRNLFLTVGVLIFVIYSVTDRFFFDVSNVTAYIIMGLGLICLLTGYIIEKKR